VYTNKYRYRSAAKLQQRVQVEEFRTMDPSSSSSSSSRQGAGGESAAPSGSGLSRSPPLVTIPAAGGSSRPPPPQQQQGQHAVPTDHHPLAASDRMDVELSEQRKSRGTSFGAPPPPPPPPPPQPPQAQQQQQTQPASQIYSATRHQPVPTAKGAVAAGGATRISGASAAATTLDDLADEFMSMGDGGVLRPPPLPKGSDAGDGTGGGVERLRVLVSRRAWGDVVALTSQLLRGPSSHYAPIYSNLIHQHQQTNLLNLPTLDSQQTELVEILTVQCQALLKMRRYADLKREVQQWTFCHFCRDGNENGGNNSDNSPPPPTCPSWVPWSLHILAASTLQYTSNIRHENAAGNSTDSGSSTVDAVDALYGIRSSVPGDDLKSRILVEQALANVLVRRRSWRLALRSVETILDLLPAACQQESPSGKRTEQQQAESEAVFRVEILSQQGRILLQVGALKEAAQLFEEASESWRDASPPGAANDNTGPQSETASVVSAQLSVNEGLLRFAYGKHTEASEFFRKAMTSLRQSSVLKTPPQYLLDDSLLGCVACHDLYGEAVNNLSLCAIYTCKLQEAIHLMESLVREGPTEYLSERVALNLW